MEQRDWHFKRGDRECGPVTRSELREMLDALDLLWTTPVRSDAMTDWRLAQEVPELLNHHRTKQHKTKPFDGSELLAEPVGMASNIPDFMRRAMAFVFDNFLVAVVMIGVELVVDHWRGRPIDSVGSNTLVFLVLGWLYFASLECNLGGTIGKLMVGLRVADVNGQPINFQRATGRYFGKILSALPLYIGFFMALFTERGQALHDKVASTVVIHRPITKEAAE